MSHFAVVVTIKLKPGTADGFRALILANAAASRQNEPGCHRFDVLVPEDDADAFVFYEEYSDAAAFEAHRESPHFKTYWQATEAMIDDRSIRRCSVIG